MVNRHPVTEPFWHPLEGSGMKLFLFMHLLRIATRLGDQIWGVMLTSTFGRGPCTYLGFLKGFLWEYPTKNQHQAALLWLVQRWYLQEMKTDGIEIDIGIMNGVMSACHLLSFFWSLFLNGWKSVVVFFPKKYVYWTNRDLWFFFDVDDLMWPVTTKLNVQLRSRGASMGSFAAGGTHSGDSGKCHPKQR